MKKFTTIIGITFVLILPLKVESMRSPEKRPPEGSKSLPKCDFLRPPAEKRSEKKKEQPTTPHQRPPERRPPLPPKETPPYNKPLN